MLVHSPEAIVKPQNIDYEVELYAGCHEDPDNIFFYMLRNIVSHLQVFRNQTFIPSSPDTSKPLMAKMFLLGTLNCDNQAKSREPIKRIKDIEL